MNPAINTDIRNTFDIWSRCSGCPKWSTVSLYSPQELQIIWTNSKILIRSWVKT